MATRPAHGFSSLLLLLSFLPPRAVQTHVRTSPLCEHKPRSKSWLASSPVNKTTQVAGAGSVGSARGRGATARACRDLAVFYEVFPLVSCWVRGASTSRRFWIYSLGSKDESDIQAQMRRGVHEDDNVRLTLFKFAVYASGVRYIYRYD